MSACAKRQCGTRAHKATLYKREDKVVKINGAIHNVLRGLYFTYCLDSRLNSEKAWSTSLGEFGLFGLIFDQNLPFLKKRVLVRIELPGAIVELTRKTKMAQGFWSCERCVLLLRFMLTRPQS